MSLTLPIADVMCNAVGRLLIEYQLNFTAAICFEFDSFHSAMLDFLRYGKIDAHLPTTNNDSFAVMGVKLKDLRISFEDMISFYT